MRFVKIIPFAFIAFTFCLSIFGFKCDGEAKAVGFFKLRRFSSIPLITREIIFSSDCTVALYDPANTKVPFVYSMTKSECDSLKAACSQSGFFDALYYDPTQHVHNPAGIDMEFLNGNSIKKVHITQFPNLPPGVSSVLACAGRIEARGLEMKMKKAEEDLQKKRKEEEEEKQQDLTH